MADRDKAKQKKRQKREQKRREHTKQEQQRQRTLSWATGPAQCYMTAEWREEGIANVMILRDGPAGRWAFATFLIDWWCIGLKDIAASDQYTPEDFRDALDYASNGQSFATISLDEARRIVAAAIRWTRMHNFRLPKGWEKAVSILGDLGDVESADISEFGKDGGLHYVGRERDLVARLTTESLADFMKRPDVQVTFMDIPEPADEETLNEMENELEQGSEEMADQVRKWCFRVGRKPEEDLGMACQIVNLALMHTALRNPSATPNLIAGEAVHMQAMDLAAATDEENPGLPSIRPAVEQVIEFARSPEGQQLIAELIRADEEDEA